MTVVIGTAGHIDHGKTALLRALTGIDADRLPEERRRGMTIDVGYAHLRMADGAELDFVDVPGHDRLVGNMLVGAGEVDAALLVVAADDGPRAQTIEHLELLDALGLAEGLAVVTKTDLVDDQRLAEVVAAVGDLLAATTLAGAPILAVSSTAGTGLTELRDALAALGARVVARGAADTREAARDPAGRPVRLAIDRVFAVRGRGTVVTGSLRGGRLTRGTALRLVPGERAIRARELQVHGAPVEAVDGGGRTALNLAGVEAAELSRGFVLTTDPGVLPTSDLIVILRPPARLDPRRAPGDGGPWPPAPGATFRLHAGTAAVGATLGRGRRDRAELPDGRIVVRVRLAEPIAARPGDPFVLRRPSPGRTAAGGRFLDVAPPVGPSRRRIEPAGLAVLAAAFEPGADRGAVAAARLALHGIVAGTEGAPRDGAIPGRTTVLAGAAVADDLAALLQAEALAAVAAHHAAHPLTGGMPLAELRPVLVRSLRRRAAVDARLAGSIVDAVLEELVTAARLARADDLLRDPGRSAELPPEVRAAMDRLEAALASPAPPPFGQAVREARCPPEGVRALEAAGRIVRLDDDLVYAAGAYRDLAALALRSATPGPLTPAALRDATGTSRKYVMAILEDLDRRGILRRTPDGHVPGPRAPR